jgi:hypothetical protein
VRRGARRSRPRDRGTGRGRPRRPPPPVPHRVRLGLPRADGREGHVRRLLRRSPRAPRRAGGGVRCLGADRRGGRDGPAADPRRLVRPGVRDDRRARLDRGPRRMDALGRARPAPRGAPRARRDPPARDDGRVARPAHHRLPLRLRRAARVLGDRHLREPRRGDLVDDRAVRPLPGRGRDRGEHLVEHTSGSINTGQFEEPEEDGRYRLRLGVGAEHDGAREPAFPLPVLFTLVAERRRDPAPSR